MKVLSIPASSTATKQLNFCPETLMIVSSEKPVKVQVRALGEGVICDLDATHLELQSNFRNNAQFGNVYTLQLADGLLKNKNIEVEITTGAATAEVYAYSTGEPGENFIITERTTILANTSQTFKKFFTLGLSALPANSQLTINYTSGETQVYTSIDEIKAIAAETHQPIAVIDNLNQDISSVVIIPTSQITVSLAKLKL